ncbi:MAG: polysaccharide ABC transporter ATP-binding protein [Cyanobacteria bacterium P01_D01_bin.1]
MTAIEPKQPVEQAQSGDDVLLSVQGISKKFCRDLRRSLIYGIADISAELTGLRGGKNTKLRQKEFWALQDVSFELKRGEALGLVGKNGSGKSTLLRIIAGLIKPDVGTVIINGRVAPLIALGAGFNPVLTGRENIYANMSILGMTKAEISERFDSVVEFAELYEAIDSPLQTYSSGMAARLGFSCAIHTEPDILLVDEVLAVGDIRFRQKCARRLAKLRENGTSFVLVSHNSQAIFTSCRSAAYLRKGQLISVGGVSEIINHYERDLFLDSVPEQLGAAYFKEKHPDESHGLDITSLSFKDRRNSLIQTPFTGEPISFVIGCKVHRETDKVNVYLMVSEIGGEGDLILSIDSAVENNFYCLSSGEHKLVLDMPYLGLRPGLYSMKIIIKESLLSTLDYVEKFMFSVDSRKAMNRSLFYQPVAWNVRH